MATDAIQPLSALALFKAVQYEIHKVEAPSFDLEEFNYFVNRAQLEYLNLRYSLYETTQQLTDDLRSILRQFTYTGSSTPPLTAGSQTVTLPEDYTHALRVKVDFTANADFGCYRSGDVKEMTAKRLTADMQGYVEQPNYYARPDYRRPYWRVMQNKLVVLSGNHAKLDLSAIELEYLRTPKAVTLYQSDVDDPTSDNSTLLDWPAYVTNELAKVLVQLILENTSNPRLQSYRPVNQTIPTQAAPAAPAPGGNAQSSSAGE